MYEPINISIHVLSPCIKCYQLTFGKEIAVDMHYLNTVCRDKFETFYLNYSFNGLNYYFVQA